MRNISNARSNEQQRHLDTALIFAVGGGEIQKIPALLRQGANPSALHAQPGGHGCKAQTTALIAAASLGHEKTLRALLSSATPGSDARNSEGDNALSAAAAAGHLASVKILLPISDANAANNRGQTALMLAARHGDLECLAELSSRSNALAKDHRGKTALMLASEEGYLRAAALLAPISDVDALDLSETSALDQAAAWEDEAMCSLLAPLSDFAKQAASGLDLLQFLAEAKKRSEDAGPGTAAARIYAMILSQSERQELMLALPRSKAHKQTKSL